MDGINIGLNLATLILVIVGGLFLRLYLPSYFEEKGKNLATKEDIADITRKVEEVRTDYARQLRAYELGYGREFEILADIWARLVELRRATLGLRPAMDWTAIEGAEEQKKARLKWFDDSFKAFADDVEKKPTLLPGRNLHIARILDGTRLLRSR